MEGRVLDARGALVTGVTVETRGPGDGPGKTIVTDGSGVFRLPGLPVGLYRVRYSKNGYQDGWRSLRVEPQNLHTQWTLVLVALPGASVEVVSQGSGFLNFKDLDSTAVDLAGVASSASQGVVTEARLEGRPILRPGELLETVPGVIVTQHSGGGKANQYFCRGFSLDHGTDFATTVAGLPVNLPTHAHGQGYLDLNFLIPELVSAIQYWKGSYLAEQGDFSNAATANVNYVNTLDRSNLSLELGGMGYRRMLYAGSTEVGSGHFLYALEDYHSDGPWDRPDDYRRLNVFLRYTQGGPENGFTVSGFGYGGSWNSNHQVPQRAIDRALIGRFGNLDASDGGQTNREALTLDWRRTTDGQQTRVEAYVSKYEVNLWNDFTFFLNSPAHGDQVEQVDRRWSYGFHLSELWNQEVAGIGLDNLAGIQVRRDNIAQVGLFPTQGRVRWGPAQADDGIDQVQVSAYTQSTLRSPWPFRAILGLREDHYSFQVAHRGPVPSGLDPGLLQGSKDASLLSPKVTFVFGPWGSTEFYLTRADGFHSNDARGIVQRENLAGTQLQVATPLVRSRAVELGFRCKPLEAWQTSLSLVRLDMDSELVFSADSGTTEPSRPSRRTGLEWSNDLSPVPGLNIDFDCAYSRARFRDENPEGNHIPEAIEGTGSLGVSARNSSGHSVNVRLRYFGPRPLIANDSARSHASILAQVRLGWELNKRISLSLEVMNLLNAKVNDIEYMYASRLRGETTEGVVDRMVHPSDPLSVRLTTSFRF